MLGRGPLVVPTLPRRLGNGGLRALKRPKIVKLTQATGLSRGLGDRDLTSWAVRTVPPSSHCDCGRHGWKRESQSLSWEVTLPFLLLTHLVRGRLLRSHSMSKGRRECHLPGPRKAGDRLPWPIRGLSQSSLPYFFPMEKQRDLRIRWKNLEGVR